MSDDKADKKVSEGGGGDEANEKEEKREEIEKKSEGEEEAEEAEEADGDDGTADAGMKHPLHTTWTLWFFKNDRRKAWSDNQRQVANFDTVEDFWSLFNHIQPASRLPAGCDYSLFRRDIQPMWEHPDNVKGGRWLIALDKSQRDTHMDTFWIETLLLLIGEAFDANSDEICGAIVQVRGKQDKLSVWTKTANNAEACLSIGRRLKEALRISTGVQIAYQTHTDQEQKSSSVAKSTYLL